ncbi:hypothetical protein G9464_05655 [Halostella sp. JP-L12]|uniref:hypothetical protein n=1 Tax=Halostella TaxID=1843185 RepID=UPI000EF7D9AE|nr:MULTISPECIES: hypothetical protein [Halostella]NHN47083.1 hypothetical protein [Halostella sp. JP-L12]
MNRREALASVAAALVPPGCLGTAADDGTTTPDRSIDDITVTNETPERTTFSVSARDVGTDALAFEDRATLEPDGEDGDYRAYADVLNDGTAYEILVETEGTEASFEWGGETDDNRGLRVDLTADAIEFTPIVH